MEQVFLLLGTNMGDRIKMLNHAAKYIEKYLGSVTQSSSVYESEPWGFEAENNFLNQVLIVHTAKDPEETLHIIKEIEEMMGRQKPSGKGYASRVIDIDILFYGNRIYHSDTLTIPHSLLQERKFTLMPLVEINPDMVHPVYQKTMHALLLECPDETVVRKMD
jgi:2-amino-4-hydroxy-6-hydroxymethyldihydropteridine diphosphokinase